MRRILGLVPAAGAGIRMGGTLPKQYLPLGGHTLLGRSVAALLSDPRVDEVLIVVSPDDARADGLDLPPRCRLARVGGASRAHSVLAGLEALAPRCTGDDIILVHDAARPCLAADDLARLIDTADAEPDGALLATPVGDTLKRGQAGHVQQTVDRTGLWRALTPQAFRLGVLLPALRAAADAPGTTDESSAVEQAGLRPCLVAGSTDNIKVTLPGDLALAEAILRRQGRW